MDPSLYEWTYLTRRGDCNKTSLTRNSIHSLAKFDDDLLGQNFSSLVVKVNKESEDDGFLLYDIKLFPLQRLDITRVKDVW
jgi:hypothetical protein